MKSGDPVRDKPIYEPSEEEMMNRSKAPWLAAVGLDFEGNSIARKKGK